MRDLIFAIPIALVLFAIACKVDDGNAVKKAEASESKRVVSVSTSDNNVSVKVKESEDVKESTSSETQMTSKDSAYTTASTPEDLVKLAESTKPTAKVAAKKEDTSKSTSSDNRPAKKPKPNPVRSAPSKYLPKIEFDELTYDFGEITEGDIVKHNFTFTNIGKSKLSIKKATATCGCTKPSFPFIDIKPGETGYIGVTYNSVNKDGDQKPEITVYSNAAEGEIKLFLTGTVKPKSKKDKADEEKSDSIEMPQDTIK